MANWQSAVELCDGDAWDMTTVEARELLRRFVIERALAKYALWDRVASEAKEKLDAMVWHRIDVLLRRKDLNSVIGSRVRWDTAHAVLEAIYLRFAPPTFFDKLLMVYESGHFPCGWQGQWPDGKLVVY